MNKTVAFGVVGCLAAPFVLIFLLVLLVKFAPPEKAAMEQRQAEEAVSQSTQDIITAAINNQIAKEALDYNLHAVTADSDNVTATLDLQFVPESRAWIAQDAARWVEILRSAVPSANMARVSMWSVKDADNVIPFGVYRWRKGGGAGWEDGPGAKLLQ